MLLTASELRIKQEGAHVEAVQLEKEAAKLELMKVMERILVHATSSRQTNCSLSCSGWKTSVIEYIVEELKKLGYKTVEYHQKCTCSEYHSYCDCGEAGGSEGFACASWCASERVMHKDNCCKKLQVLWDKPTIPCQTA